MGLEESYEVPPPCTTAQCLPPQAPNVVYERAYDQYGRPIIVVHQQPPLRTQMYATTNVAQQTHNPPPQQMYPGYMQTYQPPSQYPVHTTNPYATVTTAQYPGQYAAQPHPGALLTTPGYYYMPASTVASPFTNVAATNITATVPVPTAVPVTHANTAVAPDTLPVLAPLVSNIDQQHVSNTNHPVESTAVTAAVTNHVTVSPIAEIPSNVTLPGLTPHMSNADLQHVSNTDLQHVSNTNLEPQSAPTLPSNDPEPLVSFSNVTLVNNVLPGIETATESNEVPSSIESNEAKNSSASTAQSNEVPSSTESPARVKRSFNPLPRRQPAVKAYLAHEEL